RTRLVAGPEAVVLAVRGDGRVHHRMRAAGADHVEAAGGQADARLAGYALLGALDHRLDVAQRGIEVVPLVQPVAVELRNLVLPERLPLREHQLLQLAMRRDEQERRAGLEPDPALDAHDRLADVDSPPRAVALTELAQPVDEIRTGQRLAVEGDGNAAFPADHNFDGLGRVGRRIQQIGGWTGPAVVGPPTAVGGAPQAAVHGVAARLTGDRETARLEICYGLGALEV